MKYVRAIPLIILGVATMVLIQDWLDERKPSVRECPVQKTVYIPEIKEVIKTETVATPVYYDDPTTDQELETCKQDMERMYAENQGLAGELAGWKLSFQDLKNKCNL